MVAKRTVKSTSPRAPAAHMAAFSLGRHVQHQRGWVLQEARRLIDEIVERLRVSGNEKEIRGLLVVFEALHRLQVDVSSTPVDRETDAGERVPMTPDQYELHHAAWRNMLDGARQMMRTAHVVAEQAEQAEPPPYRRRPTIEEDIPF
jgi:hypothetical protein